MCDSNLCLCFLLIKWMCWVIWLDVVLWCVILIFSGLCNSFFVRVLILLEKVVENNRFWCFVGSFVNMWWILWIKFMLSMWLVLLRMRILIWFSFIVFWCFRFSKCFGVVISILMLLCSFIICGLIFILLNIISEWMFRYLL